MCNNENEFHAKFRDENNSLTYFYYNFSILLNFFIFISSNLDLPLILFYYLLFTVWHIIVFMKLLRKLCISVFKKKKTEMPRTQQIIINKFCTQINKSIFLKNIFYKMRQFLKNILLRYKRIVCQIKGSLSQLPFSTFLLFHYDFLILKKNDAGISILGKLLIR